MVFEAKVFHIDNLLILQLLSSDVNNIAEPIDYWICPYANFKIARCNTFELNQNSLFLPGNDDGHQELPRMTTMRFANKAQLLQWLIPYTEGYVHLNKTMPVVLDLTEIGMPEFEDVPEGKLA